MSFEEQECVMNSTLTHGALALFYIATYLQGDVKPHRHELMTSV